MRFLVPILLLLLAAGAAFLWPQPPGLDGEVATEVGRLAGQAAGVPVQIGRARVDLAQGSVLLEDLELANPEGYRHGAALRVGRLDVSLDTTVLDPAQLWLPEVRASGTVVSLELRDGGSNLQRLLERMLAAESVRSTDHGEDQPQLVIDRLAVDAAIVEVRTTGQGTVEMLEMPDLLLTDIGLAEGGLAAESAAALILRAILQRALVAAAEPALRRLTDSATDEPGRELPNAARRDAERLRQLLEDAAGP